jgi:hypothetical protein
VVSKRGRNVFVPPTLRRTRRVLGDPTSLPKEQDNRELPPHAVCGTCRAGHMSRFDRGRKMLSIRRPGEEQKQVRKWYNRKENSVDEVDSEEDDSMNEVEEEKEELMVGS